MSYIFNFGIPGLIQALDQRMRTRLDELGAEKRYRDKEHIQTRGDRTRGFSIIKKGSVCFGKTDTEGRFIVTAQLEAGQCYGEFTLFAGLPRTHDGYAVGDTVISHISKAKFDRLLSQEPQLAAPIISSLTMRLHNLLEWTDDLRRYPLRYRLGKNMLQMLKDGGGDFIEITQSELADLMGVSRVAVAQTLAEYRKLGFVASRYGGIEILNREGFKAWLEEFMQIDPIAPALAMFENGDKDESSPF